MSSGVQEPGPDDLLAAAAMCRNTLTPAVGADWESLAGELCWTCRRTLDHIADALLLYAAYLSARATDRLPPPRNGDPDVSPARLLAVVDSAAAILAAAARATPAAARAYHPAGMADASGFIAMGCVEVLIHTADIAQGLAIPFHPPADVTARVLRRLFPWARPHADPWSELCWATGRIGLPGRERLGPDWYWHCAPLSEWDGTIKKRLAPPAWS